MGLKKSFLDRKTSVLSILIVFFFLAATIPSSQATSGVSVSNSHPETPDSDLLRSQNASESKITYPLEDTVRIDPINHFKKYRGGYDIRNKHYWSSTAFTGAYGYVTGFIWLFVGVVYGGYLLVRRFYFEHMESRKLKERSTCYQHCYNKHTILGSFLAILAIVATGVVLCGSTRYHSRSRTILRIITSTEEDASRAIHNATGAMDTISLNLATENVVGRYGFVSQFLKSESKKLSSRAGSIERQAQRNRRSIGKGLSIVFIVTVVTTSLTLVSVLALSVSGLLRFQKTTCMLITFCWILTILCWLLFGAYFFLENFSKDTCTALRDFQLNTKSSSLSSILPCDRLNTAKSVLHRVSMKIYYLVNKANAHISILRKTSYPHLMYVCNPFSGPPNYLYQPENCPADTITIGQIPQVLKLFTCSENSSFSCKQGEFGSTSEFHTIQAITSSVQNLLDVYPEMQSLVDCRLVKDSFSLILTEHCRPWKRCARMVWLAVLALSIVMTILVLVFVTQAHHQQSYKFSVQDSESKQERKEFVKSTLKFLQGKNSFYSL